MSEKEITEFLTHLAVEKSVAERLHTLIHKVAWTTSTELFGELRIALRKIQETEDRADLDLGSDITAAIQTLDYALSPRGRSRHARVPHKQT